MVSTNENITINDLNLLSKALSGYKYILVGGSALPFYGVEMGTIDIDVEIQNINFSDLDKLSLAVVQSGVNADITGDISGWGMIPLPSRYKERVLSTEVEGLFILNPLDYIVSKMRRGLKKDVEASLLVCEAQIISVIEIKEHINLVELPADPVSNIFIKHMKVFCDILIQKNISQDVDISIS